MSKFSEKGLFFDFHEKCFSMSSIVRKNSPVKKSLNFSSSFFTDQQNHRDIPIQKEKKNYFTYNLQSICNCCTLFDGLITFIGLLKAVSLSPKLSKFLSFFRFVPLTHMRKTSWHKPPVPTPERIPSHHTIRHTL